MSQKSSTQEILVWGDYACFTRPEMKVERVSYEVMTPSAARNILQAILWKPSIEWQVEEITVLKPIKFMSVRRNEVKCVASIANAIKAMKAGSLDNCIYIDDESQQIRQQRAAIVLESVKYQIKAHFELTKKAGKEDSIKKFEEMFQRRVSKGQCIYQPYLGCREFTAFFAPAEVDCKPIELTKDLSWMLYDMDYSSTNEITPSFFKATLNEGRMTIPARTSREVVK